jgi:RNA 2',3'-cyclic 3'-phosphodiesterase
MIRSFIAIKIPSEIQKRIDTKVADIRNHLVGTPIRWLPAENIHLTLKFLGNVIPEKLNHLADILCAEVNHYIPFLLPIEGLGMFPNNQKPRIIWVGLERSDELITLYHGVEKVCAKIGFVSDDHSFSPHITIARVRPTINSNDILKVRQSISFCTFNFGKPLISSVTLFKSVLRPSGPVYTELYSIPLSQQLTRGEVNSEYA